MMFLGTFMHEIRPEYSIFSIDGVLFVVWTLIYCFFVFAAMEAMEVVFEMLGDILESIFHS